VSRNPAATEATPAWLPRRRRVTIRRMKDGLVPALTLAMAVLLYLFWAAAHDICRASTTRNTLEYVVLIFFFPTATLVWRKMYQIAARTGRIALLSASIAILALFALSALSASLNPKFGNDFIVGVVYLFIGTPLLVAACCALGRTLRRA